MMGSEMERKNGLKIQQEQMERSKTHSLRPNISPGSVKRAREPVRLGRTHLFYSRQKLALALHIEKAGAFRQVVNGKPFGNKEHTHERGVDTERDSATFCCPSSEFLVSE